MKKPSKPTNEINRQKALESLEILDTESEVELDQITSLVSKILKVPITLISLVDSERQWFKSKYGLDSSETSRDISFCGHAILKDETFIITNALEDERFKNNPLVQSNPHIKSYAGAVVKDEHGFNLGTLCAISDQPKNFTKQEIEILENFRDQVEIILKLRKKEIEARKYSEMLELVYYVDRDLDVTAEESINKYLQIGGALLGSELCIFSQCTLKDYSVRNVIDEKDTARQGDQFLLKDTLCYDVIHQAKTVQYKHIGNVKKLVDLPVYQNLRLESFIGTPVWINNKIYGTINFSSTKIRYDEFSQHEVKFIELLANTIGKKLEIHERELKNKEYEGKLITEKEKAKKANLSKSMFLANMSHEIRTPLNSIIGISQVLSESQIAKEHSEYLQILSRSSETLITLVNDILDLSKIESGQLDLLPSYFDASKVTKSIVDIFKIEANKKNNNLSFHSEIDGNMVYLDQSKYSQILINLIGNANKFTINGTIHIDLRKGIESEGIQVCIRDSGKGISEEKIKIIFESFTQEDGNIEKEYGGTGLGLSISQKIIELMKGSIHVDSLINEGSTFTFFIPTELSMAKADVNKAEIENKDLPLENLRILQIDDSHDNQTIINLFLKDTGVNFFTETDPVKGLELLKNNHYDIVLLDIQMPIMSGIDLANHFKLWSHENDIENKPFIIASTASCEKSVIESALSAGCSDYITKPIMKDGLLKKLIEVSNKIGINSYLLPKAS